MTEQKKIKKFNFKVIISIFVNLLLILSGITFIDYILKFNGIENVIRTIFCILLSIIILLLCLLNFKYSKKKKKMKYIVVNIISILLIGINIFGSYSLYKVVNTLNKVSVSEEIVSISLFTLETNDNNNVSSILEEDKIGSVSKNVSENFEQMVLSFKSVNKFYNEVEFYDSYFDVIDKLLNGEIKYAFLPTDIASIVASDEKYADSIDKIKSIKTYEEKIEIENTVQKDVLEPFTILLMGVDTLTSSYNADTLLVVTFNPDTLSTTMLSIPRDTYTTIACTGRKHKINSSGWSGDKCVVNTIKKYLDINIDYYVKINFQGLVQLVDYLGGIEVEVPYSFCEQNSKRQFGKNMIYVEKGLRTLNGEQALALTRNRHYWKGKCDKKYTTEGTRNDFVRGQNQQLVLKSLLNEVKNINSINTIYKILDSLGENMVTNMSTDTIMSLYNVAKDILLKMNSNGDSSNILNIQRLKFTSYTKTIRIGNLNLSTVINHENSVKAVSKQMKINLNLIEPEIIKTFSFDINEKYKETVIGSNIYGGTTIEVLPDFTGKTLSYVKKWAEDNNIQLNIEYQKVTGSKYANGTIISQNVKSNVDISTINELGVVVAQRTYEESFSYSICLDEEMKSSQNCIVKNYVGSDISVFKSWLNKTGLTIPVEYIIVTGEDEKITEQSVYDVSIYDLVKGNQKLIITYSSQNEENN